MTEADRAASPGLFETATDQEAVARAVAAAAPVAGERTDLAMVGVLDPSVREPMFELLSSLADNKYVLGRRYAEWCTGAPMLESAVAAAAMAQDELGHARSFYPLLRGFPRGRDMTPMEEKGWQQRPTSAMRCLDRRFEAWTDFLAANLVVDVALTTLLSAAVDSPYEPLRQRARKIQQEEAAHWVHGAGWLRHLGADTTDRAPGAQTPARAPGAKVAELALALERVWDDAFTWFGQDDDPVLGPLVAAGLLADPPATLRARLSARLAPALAAANLAAPFESCPLPWSRWNPATRRLTAS